VGEPPSQRRLPQPPLNTLQKDAALAESPSGCALPQDALAITQPIAHLNVEMPVGAAGDMAEPMAPFLTLSAGVEQEVEGNIGLR
jgi:hypothetical protein